MYPSRASLFWVQRSRLCFYKAKVMPAAYEQSRCKKAVDWKGLEQGEEIHQEAHLLSSFQVV